MFGERALMLEFDSPCFCLGITAVADGSGWLISTVQAESKRSWGETGGSTPLVYPFYTIHEKKGPEIQDPFWHQPLICFTDIRRCHQS